MRCSATSETAYSIPHVIGFRWFLILPQKSFEGWNYIESTKSIESMESIKSTKSIESIKSLKSISAPKNYECKFDSHSS